jgi:alkylhydroperoxidase family enzyme
VTVRDQAPAAFTAWDELIDAVASTRPTELTQQARVIARASLDPAVPAMPRSAAMDFAEQMVVDVASMTADVRAAGLAELGASAPAFVLAVWTEDMMIRAGAAWREMFGEEWRPIPTSAETDPWVAHKRFLLEVAKLRALDPVTSELVRLRGARSHDCRLCQSRRSVSAIDQAGRSDLFDDRDPSGISDAQAVALQVVDAFVWQPIQWPPGLGEQVVDALGPAAATELTLDIVRNAANKIAVALDADDPQVEAGVEYYDIDVSTGELRYDVSPVTPRA